MRCYFPLEVVNQKGKVRRTYPQEPMQAPFEKLTSPPEDLRNLKPVVTLDDQTKYALNMMDNEAANRMQKERAEMFESINRRRQRASARVEPLQRLCSYPLKRYTLAASTN